MKAIFYILILTSFYSCNLPENSNSRAKSNADSTFYRSEITSHFDSGNKKTQFVIGKFHNSLPDSSLIIQKFDSENNLIEELDYNIFFGDTMLFSFIKKNFQNGLLLSEVESIINLFKKQSFYKYSDNRIIQDSLINISYNKNFEEPADTTIIISNYHYDKKGENTEIISLKKSLRQKGSQRIDTLHYFFQYDKIGNKISSVTLQGQDTLTRDFQKFNSQNKLIRGTYINDKDEVGKLKLSYDSLGNKATTTLINPDDINFKMWHYYDDQNRLKKTVTYEIK